MEVGYPTLWAVGSSDTFSRTLVLMFFGFDFEREGGVDLLIGAHFDLSPKIGGLGDRNKV
jgi:hypothetical protein